MDPARKELARRALERAMAPGCREFALDRDLVLQGAAFSDGSRLSAPDATSRVPYPDAAEVLREINALDLDAVLGPAKKL